MLIETKHTFTRNDVPILKLASDDADLFKKKLFDSLKDWGFLVIEDHGIDLKLLDQCYQLSKEFFSQSVEEKNKLSFYDIEQKQYSNVGYFQFKSETAVSSKLADIKEFYHVGQEINPQHPLADVCVPNQWPANMPEFEKAFKLLYQQLTEMSDKLFFTIMDAMGFDTDYTRELVTHGNHILRTIHYPPIKTEDGHAKWAAQHTGIQLLGIQPRTSHPGLEFSIPDGRWFYADDDFSDALFINIGEMLSWLTKGELQPTLHRVESDNSKPVDRYAIVFFYHANPLRLLKQKDNSEESVQVGEWLKIRLKELGLVD